MRLEYTEPRESVAGSAERGRHSRILEPLRQFRFISRAVGIKELQAVEPRVKSSSDFRVETGRGRGKTGGRETTKEADPGAQAWTRVMAVGMEGSGWIGGPSRTSIWQGSMKNLLLHRFGPVIPIGQLCAVSWTSPTGRIRGFF